MDEPILRPPPVGATVHIYRGLMDRVTMWRLRIDNPTNWAVITSGTAASFSLSDASHSHAVLLLVMIFTCSFLLIEARRYRYYDLWGGWLRLLESDYYGSILLENRVALSQTWQDLVVRDMTFPHYKTTLWHSLGRRLRDNYLAIYLFLILSWLLKITIYPKDDLPPMNALTWADHAAIGPLPGVWVASGVLIFYLGLLIIMLMTLHTDEPGVEVMPYSLVLQKLASPHQQPVSERWRPDAPRRSFDHAPWDDTTD